MTTVTDRQAESPAASNALTMIVLVPSSRGIAAAVHEVVPAALPELPVEFVHVTEVTLAVAVPVMVMLGSAVATMVIPGEVMLSDGGPEVVGGVGSAGSVGMIGSVGMVGGKTSETCCVTVIALEAVWPALSVTCTVITLVPGLSGIEAIDQPKRSRRRATTTLIAGPIHLQSAGAAGRGTGKRDGQGPR